MATSLFGGAFFGGEFFNSGTPTPPITPTQQHTESGGSGGQGRFYMAKDTRQHRQFDPTEDERDVLRLFGEMLPKLIAEQLKR